MLAIGRLGLGVCKFSAIAAAVVVSVFAGCGASNVKATHTGQFDQKRPIVSLGTCCVGYTAGPKFEAIYANDPVRKTLWLPVVDRSGTPYPAGHRHDAYYTGDTARSFHSKRPAAYQFRAPARGDSGRFKVDLATIYPDLRTVDFQEFNAHDDGRLTEEGRKGVANWLHGKYGKEATIKRLGEGGFSVAYRVCPKPRECLVVKIRKMQPTFAEWKRVKLAVSAATELKRDLAIAKVADIATSWARYVGPDGKAVPLKVDGKPVAAPKRPPAGPPGRIARAAGPQNKALLKEGSVEQALIAFWADDALKKMVQEANADGSTWRTSALKEAEGHADIAAKDVNSFFSVYDKPKRFGPEVIKTSAFFNSCKKLDKLPTVHKYCVTVRSAFAIPDDFDERVQALEWMYRDTAADVILFTRSNFGRALGNPAQDGEFREIGLDYNHGRNAGWDPATHQFVLFDY